MIILGSEELRDVIAVPSPLLLYLNQNANAIALCYSLTLISIIMSPESHGREFPS